jgi:hypothetical protein
MDRPMSASVTEHISAAIFATPEIILAIQEHSVYA